MFASQAIRNSTDGGTIDGDAKVNCGGPHSVQHQATGGATAGATAADAAAGPSAAKPLRPFDGRSGGGGGRKKPAEDDGRGARPAAGGDHDG